MLAMDFEPEDVRIVVINGKEKNNEAIAAIIQNRCLRFGKPLASIVRFKELKEKEIKKLPLLSKKDKK